MKRPPTLSFVWARITRTVRQPWWLGAAVALIVFGSKLALIDAAGSDLPVWDQWDAEGAYLYRPYLEGHLSARELFSPHNEHRILFTRLLVLGLLALNGQWDGLLQMVVNAAIHAAFAGLVTALLSVRLGQISGSLAAIVLAGLFSVPAAWENVLSGFQSQFYFLLLFTFLHLAGTAYGRAGSWLCWGAQLAGGCALFTMASGVGSAATVMVLLVLQALHSRTWPITTSALLLINLGWLVLGLWLRVEHPGHESLRATSAAEYFRALFWMMAWPTRNLWLAPLLLFPFVALFVGWWRTGSPLRTLLLGLAGWWLLQLLVLAYARGTGVESPRYFDLFTLGLAIAGVAGIDLLSQARARVWRWSLGAIAAIWAGCVGTALMRVHVDIFHHLAPTLRAENHIREAVVREQVERPSPRFLQREPGAELPYPWADRLASLLAEPSLRKILPPSIRLPVPFVADPTVTHGMRAITVESPAAGIDERVWGRPVTETSSTAVFASRETPTRASRVLVRAIGSGGELRVEPQKARPLALPLHDTTAWVTWTPAVGPGSFRLQAHAPAGHWLAFAAPVEIGHAAWLARRTAAEWLVIVLVGGAALLAAILGHLRSVDQAAGCSEKMGTARSIARSTTAR
jgi:hypothetical protein